MLVRQFAVDGICRDNLNILSDKNRICFQSDRRFFCLKNGKISQIDVFSDIYSSLVVRNKFYMTSSKGLMILNGTEFIPVDNTSDIGSTVKQVVYCPIRIN